MAQTGRNMLVRFELKLVLECLDNEILVFRMNFYDRLTQRPLLDHLSARPCAHFFSSLSTVFYKFDAIFRSFHSMILPNALLSTDGNFILKHFPENHAFATSLKMAFKNVTTKMSQIRDVFYFNVNIRTKHNIIYHS